MSEIVTVELPDELARRARAMAAYTQRRVEEVLIEWIDRAGAELSLELLPDDQILAVCDEQMDSGQQEELSNLLAHNREEELNDSERQRLDALMWIYRRGLVRKAHALKVAVARGLKPRLS